MAPNPKYRFSVNGHPVNPIYKDDLAKEYELETGQQFFRQKLSGKLSFVRQDFNYLHAQPFDTVFNFLIEITYDFGTSWEPYFRGKFLKTDCEWNLDDLKVEVQPDPEDEYSDLVAGLERELDLIKLAPEMAQIAVDKRPIIQVYLPGDSVVTNFLGGTHWEQSATEETDLAALETHYRFALSNLLKEINLTITGTPSEASGLYTGRMVIVTSGSVESFSGNLFNAEAPGWRLEVTQTRLDQAGPWSFESFECRLVRVSDDAVFWQFEDESFQGADYDFLDFNLDPVQGSGSAAAEMATYRIYTRYLLNVPEIKGIASHPMPEPDLVAPNPNYRRVMAYDFQVAFISMRFTDTPNRWGLSDNGRYFLPPAGIGVDFYPISRSSWRYASIWFAFSEVESTAEPLGRDTYILRDAYPFHAALRALVRAADPTLEFLPTPEYSQVLFGSTDFSGYVPNMFVSQKSNLKAGNYDQAAQHAKTTLQHFTNLLRDALQCFWFVEEGKFRVEHIHWFKRGGSYNAPIPLGLDLTTFLNRRNGKSWGYLSDSWTFDKQEMPERFEFSWMDEVTPPFEGEPMEVRSNFVEKGLIGEINVSHFTTDVDYILANPGAINDEGFVLLDGGPSQLLKIPDDGVFSGASPYAIRTAFGGRAAVASFRVNGGNLGDSGNILFYRGETLISTQGSFTLLGNDNENFNIPVTIPQGADFMGFTYPSSALGISFFLLEVPSVPQVRYRPNVNAVNQNGFLGWPSLQDGFYRHDLPSWDVWIGGDQVQVLGVRKLKRQEVRFPLLEDLGTVDLVKTGLGNGQVNKISVNLLSRMHTVELKHDTEQQP